MVGWMGRCARVGDLLSSLYFHKGGDDKGEAQTQAPLSALKMLRDLCREDKGEREKKKPREREGSILNTQIFISGESPEGGDEELRISV